MRIMYCMHCGTKNPDGAKFCNNCGKAMNTAPSGRKSSGIDLGTVVSVIILIVCAVFALKMAVRGFDVIRGWFGNGELSLKSESSQVQQIDKQAAPKTEAAPAPAPKAESGYIADLGGSWESVKLKDGNANLNVSALAFSQKVYNCTSLTVNMDVTMNAGTSCKDWNVWARSGGSFVKVGKVYLASGNGYVSQTLTFSSPVSFDAIAITPTVVGGYSWSMGLSITDVYYK